MTKMPNRARKVSFSPPMLAILGIWFLANLLRDYYRRVNTVGVARCILHNQAVESFEK